MILANPALVLLVVFERGYYAPISLLLEGPVNFDCTCASDLDHHSRPAFDFNLCEHLCKTSSHVGSSLSYHRLLRGWLTMLIRLTNEEVINLGPPRVVIVKVCCSAPSESQKLDHHVSTGIGALNRRHVMRTKTKAPGKSTPSIFRRHREEKEKKCNRFANKAHAASPAIATTTITT